MKNETDNNDGDGNDSAVLSISMNGVSVEAVSAASKKKHKKRKAAKGQLKKLWRRATGGPPGIISRCDWNSLVDLHSDYKISSSRADESRISIGSTSPQGKGCGGGVATDHEAMMGPLPGPTICLATENRYDFAQLENWQTSEGCDHRDVLVNLLFGQVGLHNNSTPAKAKKKRKVCPISTKDIGNLGVASRVHVPPLPSWSTICNQASIGGVAIIEVEIVGGDTTATSCPLMPSRRIANSMTANCENVWSSLIHREINGNREPVENQSNKVKRTISAACRVNLFQEKNEPRSISDVLMFLPPPPPPDQSDDLKTSSGDFDIFRAMNNLLLKPKQMRSEGFPTLSNTNTTDTTVDAASERKLAMKTVCEIAKSSLDTKYNALQLVRTLSVNVISNDMDATIIDDDFSAMEYYIKSFSHRCASHENSDSSTSCSENDFKVRQRRLFALDCEMVKTSSEEPELARVSMIMFTGYDEDNERSTVVLDELVKPRRTVLDHLTHYSGITPKMLQSVDTRIEDIQVRLLSMIDEDDILVGHSLENDLRALRIVHDKIIDTSMLFRGTNGRKFSLKHLSNVLLQKKIQCSSLGHCSTEDAEAALTLALRRARRGDSFKLKENSTRHNIISAFQKLNREANGQTDAEKFAERNDGSCVCIGDNDWISKYAQMADGAHHVLTCDSIMSAMSMAIPSWLSNEKSTKRAGLLWANLHCEGRRCNGIDGWKSEVSKLDEIVQSLVERVPTHIPILMIFQSNYKKASVLTQQRKLSNNPKVTLRWTSEQEEQWRRCVEECRNCEAIWIGSACPISSSRPISSCEE